VEKDPIRSNERYDFDPPKAVVRLGAPPAAANPPGTNSGSGRIIAPGIRIRQRDSESARCSGSNRPDPGRFLSMHATVHNTFHLQRHLVWRTRAVPARSICAADMRISIGQSPSPVWLLFLYRLGWCWGRLALRRLF
jgi:hypothetical protein